MSSLTFCNISLFFTRSVQLIFSFLCISDRVSGLPKNGCLLHSNSDSRMYSNVLCGEKNLKICNIAEDGVLFYNRVEGQMKAGSFSFLCP
jgi:hypothetical protein